MNHTNTWACIVALRKKDMDSRRVPARASKAVMPCHRDLNLHQAIAVEFRTYKAKVAPP